MKKIRAILGELTYLMHHNVSVREFGWMSFCLVVDALDVCDSVFGNF